MVGAAAVLEEETAVCFDFGAISMVKIFEKELRESLKALRSESLKVLKINLRCGSGD